MKLFSFLLLLIALVASCGDGGSMGDVSQDANAVMGSKASMMPDESMTPTPTMPMMQMMPGQSR